MLSCNVETQEDKHHLLQTERASREPAPSGAKHLLMNLAVVAVTVVFFAGAMELMLRVVFAHSLDFNLEMWKYAVKLKHPVPDPHLSFAHIPNSSAFLMGAPVSINSRGLRDREYTEQKPLDVYRIVILGDSTTF